MWYSTLQAVIGKLYVLSHFYSINSRPPFVGEQEQPATYTSSLTVPAFHGMSAAHNAPEEHTLELYSDSFERTEEGSGSEFKTAPVSLGGLQPMNGML